jgi:hypothetical protein
VPNKRTLILVSSLTTISLATLLLVASAFHRRKRKSPRTHGFLGQTRSTKGVDTTSSITYRQQLREKSQRRQPTPSQGAKTKAVTRTITNATASSKKDPTTTATIPSPIAPSTTSDRSAIISSSQTPKEEEISVSDEARKAGESLKELIVTAIKEAKDSAKGTGKRLKEQTINISTTVDSKDIRSLGHNVNASVQLFEETMTKILKEPYDEQIKLLDSYKDPLKTHINVINARGRMASKLKPGAGCTF